MNRQCFLNFTTTKKHYKKALTNGLHLYIISTSKTKKVIKMSNMKKQSIVGATFKMFQAKLDVFGEKKDVMFVGVLLPNAPEDQVWISNDITLDAKFYPSIIEGNARIYKRIQELKATGTINLVDDFNPKVSFPEMELKKSITWKNI